MVSIPVKVFDPVVAIVAIPVVFLTSICAEPVTVFGGADTVIV